MIDGKFWVIDTEGNGANPNEPIELGLVEMEGLELTGRMHNWRFKPFSPITFYATKVHGITNAEIENEPGISELVDEIMESLENRPIMGHMVISEINILSPHLPAWKPRAAYDTLKIARQILTEQKQHKLSVLVEQFGIAEKVAQITGRKIHSGLFDAAATAMVFQELSRLSPDKIDRIVKTSDIVRGIQTQAAKDAMRTKNKALKLAFRKNQGARSDNAE